MQTSRGRVPSVVSTGSALAVVLASCTSAGRDGAGAPTATTTPVATSASTASDTTSPPPTASTVPEPTTVAPAQVSGQVLVNPCGSGPVKEPPSIVLACGDGNAQVVHLVWTSWGSSEATATGDYAVNDCTPTCVGGKFHEYPATIILADVKVTGGSRYFMTMTVHPTAGSPFDGPSRDFPIGS